MNNEYIELINAKSFDFSLYENTYNVADGIIDYLENWQERKLYIPNNFDSEYYLNTNKDVLDSEFNPLIHYILFGENEGRKPVDLNTQEPDIYKDFLNSVFIEQHYNQYEIESDNFTHFFRHGRFDNWRTPSELLDRDFIKSKILQKNLALEFNDIFYCAYKCNLSGIEIPYSDSVARFSKLYDFTINDALKKLTTLCCEFEIYDKTSIDLLISIFIFTEKQINNFEDTIQSLKSKIHRTSVYFNEEYLMSSIGKTFNSTIECFKYWLEKKDIIPTAIFDVEIYKNFNKDLSGSDLDLYIHFILHGQYEGRIHSKLLNFIDDNIGKDKSKCFSLFENCDSKYFSQSIRIFIENNFKSQKPTLTEWMYLIDILCELKRLNLNQDAFLLFLAMFNIDELYYHFDKSSFSDVILKWKNSEYKASFSPYFSPYYISNNVGENLKENSLVCYAMWYDLRHNFDCSPLFSSKYYLDNNPDLTSFEAPLIEHFFYHGIFENRKPSLFIDLPWINYFYGEAGKTASDVFFAHEYSNKHIKPTPYMCTLFNSPHQRLSDFAIDIIENENYFKNNQVILEQIKHISLIEPKIKPNIPNLPTTFMPYNIDNYPYLIDLPNLIGTTDILLFRDSINFGGADAVLSYLARALENIYPTKKIKIISLGKVSREALSIHRIDPEMVLDISKLLMEHCHYKHIEALSTDLIYDIVIGSNCNMVFNVNCGPMWKTLSQYGTQLSQYVKFYSYLFCDDRDEFGNVDGYPSRYFIDTFSHNSNFLVDSKVLKKDLGVRTNYSSGVMNKIKHLKTPISFDKLDFKDLEIKKGATKNIVWAGRFDHQKRPDILIEVAKIMPEYNFYVWGKPVLSNNKFDFSQCENIRLMGLFEDISEILEVQPLLFLYTSEWDGVPTMLLKVMQLGVPIIASNAGGVSEVINDSHLVNNINNPAEYRDKILQLLSYPDEVLRTEFTTVLNKRNFESYVNNLAQAIHYDDQQN